MSFDLQVFIITPCVDFYLHIIVDTKTLLSTAVECVWLEAGLSSLTWPQSG